MDFVFLGASALMAAALFGLISFCDRLGNAPRAGLVTPPDAQAGSGKTAQLASPGGRK